MESGECYRIQILAGLLELLLTNSQLISTVYQIKIDASLSNKQNFYFDNVYLTTSMYIDWSFIFHIP